MFDRPDFSSLVLISVHGIHTVEQTRHDTFVVRDATVTVNHRLTVTIGHRCVEGVDVGVGVGEGVGEGVREATMTCVSTSLKGLVKWLRLTYELTS